MLRRLLTVRWLVALVVTLAGAAGMVRLGMWQLGRGEARNSIQNYSYAVEWVLFAAFTVFCFVKLLRDEGTEDDPADATVSELMPRPAPAAHTADEEPDEELAAYNAYLARLNAEHS